MDPESRFRKKTLAKHNIMPNKDTKAHSQRVHSLMEDFTLLVGTLASYTTCFRVLWLSW